MALRLVFMGTPDFAVPTLRALVSSKHQVVAVYTREPKRADRKLELKPSEVAREAAQLGLTVFTPKSFKDSDAATAIRAHTADLAVVVAYALAMEHSPDPENASLQKSQLAQICARI